MSIVKSPPKIELNVLKSALNLTPQNWELKWAGSSADVVNTFGVGKFVIKISSTIFVFVDVVEAHGLPGESTTLNPSVIYSQFNKTQNGHIEIIYNRSNASGDSSFQYKLYDSSHVASTTAKIQAIFKEE